MENRLRPFALIVYDHGQKVRGKVARKTIEDEIERKVMKLFEYKCENCGQIRKYEWKKRWILCDKCDGIAYRVEAVPKAPGKKRAPKEL